MRLYIFHYERHGRFTFSFNLVDIILPFKLEYMRWPF